MLVFAQSGSTVIFFGKEQIPLNRWQSLAIKMLSFQNAFVTKIHLKRKKLWKCPLLRSVNDSERFVLDVLQIGSKEFTSLATCFVTINKYHISTNPRYQAHPKTYQL